HRSDLLAILYDACLAAGVGLQASKDVVAVTGDGGAAAAECADGTSYQAAALIAADGLHSGIRALFSADQPVCSGFAAYRGTASIDEVTARSELDEVVAWIGPELHFVQYPLRAGQIYNQVAVFRSRRYAADPGLADGEWGGPGELDEAFGACCAQVREATGFLWRDRWWPMYDREPLAGWTRGRIALLGDAAHPMLQYLAQGACMAIEDAVTLGAALREQPDDIAGAFRTYQKARYLRTGRVQLTARFYGEIYHAGGVMRELRNRMFQSGSEVAGFIGTHWLYRGIDPERPFG
ncbi:MAG TPA: FAD-dependent monooxygenase, partial [Burkholderiaceae bacterium]|nr:FAD-dependent monooxygenase [Burkholderiaceae bacterium]